MQCGLLGAKLGHSYSPQIHARLGSYSYSLFEKSPQELEGFLLHGDFNGLNVTIPYKKAVIPFCRSLSPRAQALGAVNTLVRQPDGSLIGHNTDYYGFEAMVKQSALAVSGKKALVLGSGGASNTAAAVLKDMGARVVVISRSGENNYTNLHLHEDAALLINATPVGMYPSNGVSPVDLERFPRLEGVLDLIYNPARTRLLLDAQSRGLVAVNGLKMLVAQAKESAEWFTGTPIEDSAIDRIYRELKNRMENTVLIGMPGSGKTTVGKALSRITGKEFVDSDAVLENQAGRSIPEILSADGEEVFRAMETRVLSELASRSGIILSTGGGCVTREENFPLLRQNGTVFWLQREIGKLPTQGRPLSQAGALSDMYARRQPLYRHFANRTVDNNGSLEDTVAQILKEE